MNRHDLLDLVMAYDKGRADVEFDSRGDICVTTWDKSGKIKDVWNSYNYHTMGEFYKEVKQRLK